MKIDKNICIRIDRDQLQIERGKELIEQQFHQIEVQSKEFSLMGNPIRLSILLLLFKEHKLCVCDISEILSMKIPAISQHLRKLKDGGIVSSKREGTLVFYSMNQKTTLLIKEMLSMDKIYI